MPNIELELNPVDFITIGTIGPKGKRVFYLQAGYGKQVISLVIEKEQSWALSEAIQELIDDLETRYDTDTSADLDISQVDMDLREPIDPIFRVSQMGLGYDEEQDRIVLVAQELVPNLEDEEIGGLTPENEPGIVRLWCTREQMRALSLQAMETVKSGRADPKQNGRLVYYWT
ncbi:MAG: DUF3090 domain-containing protein [Anaerolineae bacterium]